MALSFELFMIDILCCIIVCLAIIQGWRKGFILALFSMVCGLIGLAAAVKLSAVLATHMKSDLHMSSRWLPFIAFVLIFVMVLLIIRWVGKLLEKLVQMVLLGWLNKLCGILLFLILYLSIYSIFLFLWNQNPGDFKAGSGQLASLFLDCTLWSGSNSFYYRIHSCGA